MKKLLLLLSMVCMLSLFGCPSDKEATAAENPTQAAWGSELPAADAKVVSEEQPGGLRKGLTLRQRRAMGLTYKNIKTIVERKQAAGELKDIDACCLAVEIAEELFDGNPQAFADPALDWDAILEFLEKLIPFILKIIALFS